MLAWLRSLFGGSAADTAPVVAPALAPAPAPEASAPPSNRRAADPALRPPAGRVLREIERRFLDGFLNPPEAKALDLLPADDRLFLGGVRGLWHSRTLDLPVLPQAAIELRTLLATGNVAVAKLAQILDQDSALSVEVLKTANSAAYAAAAPAHSTQEALVRIGLERLEGVLLVSQLRTKVLKAGPFQRCGELLVDLSTTLSTVAMQHAQHCGGDPRVAFTRAILLHIEHLVILGAVADVSRSHKRAVTPSLDAFHQAFSQLGPEIREAVAHAWHLESLLIGTADDQYLHTTYSGLREAVIRRWMGQPLPHIEGVEPDLLLELLGNVPRRERDADAGPRAA